MKNGQTTAISARAIILLLVCSVIVPALGLRPADNLSGGQPRPDYNTAVSVRMTVTYELPQTLDPSVLRPFRTPDVLESPRDGSQVPYVRSADANSPRRTQPRDTATERFPSPEYVIEQNRRMIQSSCALPDECREPEDCAPGGISPACGATKVCCVPMLEPGSRSPPNAGGRKPGTGAKDPNSTKAPVRQAPTSDGFDDGLPAAFHGYLLLSEYPRMPPPAPNSIGRTAEEYIGAKSKSKLDQTAKGGVYDSARRGGPPLRAGTPGTTPLSRLQRKITELLPETSVCGPVYVDSRITKGKTAQIGQFPWMALLGFKYPPKAMVNFICGGSLINDRYVLTAAHCFTAQNILAEVRLGEYDLAKDPDGTAESPVDPVRKELVEEIIIHPNFSRTYLKHDIALVRLQNRVQRYTSTVKPVCLPINVDFTPSNYTIAGWGKTDISNSNGSTIIQLANVQVLNHTECVKRASPYNSALSTSQMCAGGKKGQDVCSGDSGGPLIKIDVGNGPYDIACTYVAGVVSFGADAPCGTAGLPSVYTRVESYVPWILENMRP